MQASDAAAVLTKRYCNGSAKLSVSNDRDGLILREDGIAFDDGAAAQ